MAVCTSSSRWHNVLRRAVFALLACNTLYYLYTGPLSKLLDAVAWFVLLILYALEAGDPRHIAEGYTGMALRALRLAAATGVCGAGFGYIIEQNSLDAINTGLWIAVVALLEFEVRRPLDVARYHIWFTASAATLYTALAGLVLAWAWRGAWLDAYDALLWLVAFVTIETDMLKKPARRPVV